MPRSSGTRRAPGPRKARRPAIALILYAALLLLGYLAVQLAPALPPRRELAYSEFLAEVRAGRVTAVLVTDAELVGTLKPDALAGVEQIVATRVPGVDGAALLQELQAAGVKVSGRRPDAGWWPALGWIVPVLLLLLFYSLVLRRMGQGAASALTFGRNRARIADQSAQGRVTFADVAGVDEAEAELVEVVDFLKHPERYRKLGGRIPRGVLLVGPPGTGKTLLARAAAGEAGVPFFVISGSEFVEMFVGVGAARVRDLFEQAKQRAPCIIFIDELDAVGKTRSAGHILVGNEEREQTLNQLLAEMDGFDSSKGVIILAATNAPESLDPALLRGGRFDRQVAVDRPDLKGREAILRVHARGVTLDPRADLGTVAARTPGMVGADLANVVNEAALLAARRGAGAVEMRDLEDAIDRVMLGLEKRSRVMSAEEKRRVAYHEGGHALVALSVPHAAPVHRVSIIPRTIGALGHTLQLPTQEKFLVTTPELEDQMTVMLGGRAAEELAFGGVVSTGAADDLARAAETARQMVTRFGMTDRLGVLTYGRPVGARFLPSLLAERDYSERTAQAVDEESRRLVEAAHRRAGVILSRRREELDRIAAALVERETLERSDLEALLLPPEGRSPRARLAPVARAPGRAVE